MKRINYGVCTSFVDKQTRGEHEETYQNRFKNLYQDKFGQITGYDRIF